MQRTAFNVALFMDPENTPDFRPKLVAAQAEKEKQKAAVEDMMRRIHEAERNEQRNKRLLAKGQQYLQAFEARKDVLHMKEYHAWLKAEEAQRAGTQLAEDVEKERQRKKALQEKIHQQVSERHDEAVKIRQTLKHFTAERDEKRRQDVEENQTRAREMREQSEYNRFKLRNQLAQDVVKRHAERTKEREETSTMLKTRRSAQSPGHQLPEEAKPRKAVTAPVRPKPPVIPKEVIEKDTAEIDKLMEELDRAQDRLRETRKEFELVALRTNNLPVHLVGTPSQKSPKQRTASRGATTPNSKLGFFLTERQ